MKTCDPITADIRADICAKCPTPCEHQRDPAWHASACTACPLGRYGTYGACADTAPVAAAPSPLPRVIAPSVSKWRALLRTLRGWKRAGFSWDDRSTRRAKWPHCSACEHVGRDARTGLIGCRAGCSCGVAAVAVIRVGAKCKYGKWPSVS
jgi:hypothetical protein